MTSHVGAINSCIVRPTHSIFTLLCYKEQEHPPVNHKVIAKLLSCDNQMEQIKATVGKLQQDYMVFHTHLQKRDHMGMKVIQMRSLCSPVFRRI